MDRNSKVLSIETGIGFGVTAGADKLTLKLMLWRDLNRITLALTPAQGLSWFYAKSMVYRSLSDFARGCSNA